MAEKMIVEIGPETLKNLAFEVGKAMMLPPKKHQTDSVRAGKAFCISRSMTHAANQWTNAILIPAVGNTRLQIFEAIVWPTEAAAIPYLCFFKGQLPATQAEVLTDNSKPSNSVALAPFTPREIHMGLLLSAAVTGVSQVTTFKGQSGLGEPGEGFAIISRGTGADFGQAIQGNFTYREIIDPR